MTEHSITSTNLMMFIGYDGPPVSLGYGVWKPSGNPGLYVTNAATGGTYELTGIAGASTGQNVDGTKGFDPSGLTSLNGEVIFSAHDASGKDGLWVSNGTAAGTHELSVAGAAKPNSTISGFDPSGFTVVNGEVLFEGYDASGKSALWATNGTAAGTHELSGSVSTVQNLTVFKDETLFSATDASGKNGLWVTNGTAAGTHELSISAGSPQNLTVFKGETLFSATDASGKKGLWVTNGTAAGTHELTGIAGASASGINPSGFTAFNGEVLFEGSDAGGKNGLWVTNGTTAGTHELTGIAGASASGINPSGFTAFDGEALFSGADASGNKGLWVTNGTSAGTHELNSSAGGFQNLTVFNGEALFTTTTTVIQMGAYFTPHLWVTDGTVAGTHELTGIAGASSGRSSGFHQVTYGLDPSGFTVFNGEVLFSGYGSSGNGLWVTNGTAAGTHELTGIAGASTGKDLYPSSRTLSDMFTGIYPSGLSPSGFTVANGKVLFNGYDSTGKQVLWATDGTAAGTHEIPASEGLSPTSVAGVRVPVASPVTPVITKFLASPGSGDLAKGAIVTVTVDFSKPVTVVGAPTLTLNDGGAATYTKGSGTSALTFTYKVAAGQNIADLQAIGIALPSGASIKDSAGHAADLTGAHADFGLKIATSPVVSAINYSDSGLFHAGLSCNISLAMNEAMVVKGAPTLTLNDGGIATYDAAKSTPTNLVFDYKVMPGQNTTALTATKVNLPAGSSIEDHAGNALIATLPMHVAVGLQVDTTAPTVTSVTASPSSGTVSTGSTVAITLKLSEAVPNMTGSAALLLNDGGTATYDAKHSTATSLAFDYTVPSSQGTKSLSIIGVKLDGVIEDAAYNDADFTKAAANLGVKVNAISTGPASVTLTGMQEAEIFGASSQKVTFTSGDDEALRLDAAQSFTGKISGFTSDNAGPDLLDLANLAFGPHMTVGYSGTSAGGTLTIGNGTQTDKIALLGNYMASTFTLLNDWHGGTNVIVDPPKIAATPLIASPHA